MNELKTLTKVDFFGGRSFFKLHSNSLAKSKRKLRFRFAIAQMAQKGVWFLDSKMALIADAS